MGIQSIYDSVLSSLPWTEKRETAVTQNTQVDPALEIVKLAIMGAGLYYIYKKLK